MKKRKAPKRRNIYAASLADNKFKARVVAVKKRKLVEKELNREMYV